MEREVYSVAFPKLKKVQVNQTFYPLDQKLKYLKEDKDNILYDYLNSDLKVEVQSHDNTCKEVMKEFVKKSYKPVNVNLLPPGYKRNKEE